MAMDYSDEPSQVERDIQFETVYQRILPKLENHGGKLVAAQLMLILQLEGAIGKTLKERDIELLESLKEKLLSDERMCNELVDIIEKLKTQS